MNRKVQVVVIGSSTLSAEFNDAAYQIGKLIADRGYVLITGGRTGVMQWASKGAFENGGIVVGILPGNSFSDANSYCSIVIPTAIGYARNSMNVLCADLVISICGESGTLAELAYAWQYKKKIVCCSFTGGWSEKLAGTQLDNRRTDTFIDAKNINDVAFYLDNISKDTQSGI